MELPFYNEDLLELIDDIEYKKLQFPKTREISNSLKAVFLRLLEKDPNKRITLEFIIIIIIINILREIAKTE